MSTEVILPVLGESVSEGTVSRWLKKVGDTVIKDEALLEVNTDKVDTEVPAPATGVLTEIRVREDETVPVGSILGIIGTYVSAAPVMPTAFPTPSVVSALPISVVPPLVQPAFQPSPPTGQPAPITSSIPPIIQPLPVAQPASEPPQVPSPVPTPSEMPSYNPAPTPIPSQTLPTPAQSTPLASSPIMPPAPTTLAPASLAPNPVVPPAPQVAEPALPGVPPADGSPQVTPYVTPLVRKLAAEAGLSLSQIEGSGVGGRIRKQDILDAVTHDANGPIESTATEPTPLPAVSVPDTESPTAPAPGLITDSAVPTPAAASPIYPEATPEDATSLAAQTLAAGVPVQTTPAPETAQSVPSVAPVPPDATPVPELLEPPTVSPEPVAPPASVASLTPVVTPAAPEPSAEPTPDLTTPSLTSDLTPGPEPTPNPVSAVAAPTPAPAEEHQGAGDICVPVEAPVTSLMAGKTEKLSRLRLVLARRVVEFLHVTAQLTATVEVDLTAISRLRNHVKDEFKARKGVSLSYLPFIAKATLEALKQYPLLNTRINIDEGTITYPNGEHLGIAVDTPKGLLVPVIKCAGDLTVSGIATRIADLASRTRNSQISPDDLVGGTFTITNYGSVGTLLDTPIINPPQVGILGVGAITRRPVVVDDPQLGEVIAVRDMAYISLSYDHRLIDGADAARFLGTIKTRLEAGDFGAEF